MFNELKIDHLKKYATTNEKYILRKMGLKFQSPKFNIYAK